jgi:sulfite exporter TauE/SafE
MIGQLIIGGLSLGLFSSFHCIGMCGPLIAALPVSRFSAGRSSLSMVVYHCGRILTYIIIGLIFASLGRGIYIAGWQQFLSIALGAGMILIVAFSLLSENLPPPRFITVLHQQVYRLMAITMKNRNRSGLFFLGMINGLLPCGMVYLAIAGVFTSSQVWQGALFMGSFGLGTLPALALLSLFSYRISLPVRNAMKKLMPAVIVIMGILLICRGMNLGIPFLSPMLPSAPGEAVHCH